MTAVWIVGGALAYLFMSGITQRISEEFDRAAGRKVDDAPFGLLWPLILPWALGELIVFGGMKLIGSKPKQAQLPEAKVHKSTQIDMNTFP